VHLRTRRGSNLIGSMLFKVARSPTVASAQ
jgi:hypothetical protein